jgi:hypothetical protein
VPYGLVLSVPMENDVNEQLLLSSEYYRALSHFNWAIKELRAQSGRVSCEEWERFMNVIVKPAWDDCRILYEHLSDYHTSEHARTLSSQQSMFHLRSAVVTGANGDLIWAAPSGRAYSLYASE